MSESKKIAVAGATGRVGHHVVDVLAERGHEVVPISRTDGVDVITGAGSRMRWPESSASSTRPPARRLSSRPRPSSSRPRPPTCRRPARAPACNGSSSCRSSTRTGCRVATRSRRSPMSARCSPGRFRRACSALRSSTNSSNSSCSGVRRETSRTSRRCARSWSPRARSPRRLPIWRSIPPQRRADARGRRTAPREPRRDGEAARRPTWQRLRVEEVSDPVDGSANESGVLLPGPGARLGGPTFEEWLDSGGADRRAQGSPAACPIALVLV